MILGRFRVKHQRWAVVAGKRKWKWGYALADLKDVFARYLPASTAAPSAGATSSATSGASGASGATA